MSTSSPASSARKRQNISLEERLDALLAPREELQAQINAANDKRASRLAKVERRYDKDVGEAPKKLLEIDNQLTAFLERHHYQLTRRLSKTIKRAQGEVKFVLRATELELPKNEEPIIRYLLKRWGGKRYLIQTWRVNRRAILQAPASLFKELKPHGVWRGRHRQITVKSRSNNRAITLSQKRFNERTH